MADIRLLERTLRETVTLNKARGNFLAKFLVALVQVKTVNLSEIAQVFEGRAKADSHYKRIQRFLRFFEVPYAVIALCLLRLLPIEAPYVLTLDRTNWQLGQTPLNRLRCKNWFEARKVTRQFPLRSNMEQAQDKLRLTSCITSR